MPNKAISDKNTSKNTTEFIFCWPSTVGHGAWLCVVCPSVRFLWRNYSLDGFGRGTGAGQGLVSSSPLSTGKAPGSGLCMLPQSKELFYSQEEDCSVAKR